MLLPFFFVMFGEETIYSYYPVFGINNIYINTVHLEKYYIEVRLLLFKIIIR